MRTTLIHHGALGDWMLVMPMLRALLAQSKDQTITAGQSHAKSNLACRLMPELKPLTIDTPAWADLFAPDADPPAHVVETLRGSDRIISFVSTPHDVWYSNVARLAPHAHIHCLHARPVQCSTSIPSPSFSRTAQHITAYHAAQLAAQGLRYAPAHAVRPAKPLKENDTADRPILIHPGSGGRDKNWSTILWESFMTHAQNDGWYLQPILGEVELETWPAATLSRWTTQYGAIACTTLDELTDLLAAARGLIAQDTGPSHLAAVMNIPTIVLYGPTSPAVWSPFGPHVHLIAPPTPSPMTWLHPDHVTAALEQVF